MSSIPADLKYAKTHEWVRIEGDQATVGITDHAQHELTDVVFVELPSVGRSLKVGESCAVVESVKTASDIYAPIAGEVVAVNPALAANPGLINTSPYVEGWFFKVRTVGPPDAGGLFDAAAYGAQIGG